LNGFGDASPIGKRFRYELMRKDRNSGKFRKFRVFRLREENLLAQFLAKLPLDYGRSMRLDFYGC
jgi:muconolactone delta-isomerase